MVHDVYTILESMIPLEPKLNSSEVHRRVFGYLSHLNKIQKITDFGTSSAWFITSTLNPNSEFLKVKMGVMMPDGSNPQAHVEVHNNNISVFVRHWPGTEGPPVYPSEAIVTLDDDYDRAMRGI